jgi:HSP20 family protein
MKMNVVKWKPMMNMLGVQDRMNRMLDDFFYPTSGWSGMDLSQWNPVVDIVDTENEIVIKADLPGIDKKDISVDVTGRVLTLKGERSDEREEQKGDYYRRERSFGRFERAFTLPDEVDPGLIKAAYKDGVLRVEVPKSEKRKPKQITVH